MKMADDHSNQLNAALLQLGTAHDSAFSVANQQRVVVQRHVDQQELWTAKAEYRGNEALKVTKLQGVLNSLQRVFAYLLMHACIWTD